MFLFAEFWHHQCNFNKAGSIWSRVESVDVNQRWYQFSSSSCVCMIISLFRVMLSESGIWRKWIRDGGNSHRGDRNDDAWHGIPALWAGSGDSSRPFALHLSQRSMVSVFSSCSCSFSGNFQIDMETSLNSGSQELLRVIDCKLVGDHYRLCRGQVLRVNAYFQEFSIKYYPNFEFSKI